MQEFTPHQLVWLLNLYFGDVRLFGQDFRNPALKSALISKPESRVKATLRRIPLVARAVRLLRGGSPTAALSSNDVAFTEGEAKETFGLIAMCRSPRRRVGDELA